MRSDWQYVFFISRNSSKLIIMCSVYNLQRKLEGSFPLNQEEYDEQNSSSRSKSQLENEHGWRRGYEDDAAKIYSIRRKAGGKSITPSPSVSESSSHECSECSECERAQAAAWLDADEDYSEYSGSMEPSEEEIDQDAEDQAVAGIGLVTGQELRLSNGKVVGNKSSKREVDMEERKTRRARDAQRALEGASATTSDALTLRQRHSPPLTEEYLSSFAPSDPSQSSSRELQLSKRDAMGVVGLHDSEKRALMATQKRMVTLEVRVIQAFQRKVDAKGNCQKHYRIGGSRGGKKMGGLEKRLG
jgi:hypothetical protein